MANFSYTMGDNLRSLVSGMGDPSRDKAASLFHAHVDLSDEQLLASYRGSWIAKKTVDIPALDMLRKGRDWQAEQEQITLIEKEEKRLNLWAKLLQCKTAARLWGGAVLVIGEENQADYSEPFDVEKVKKGGIPYLTVMSRKDISVVNLDEDPLSEFYGKPKEYAPNKGENVRIHPSRVVVQIGSPQADPFNAPGLNFGWGDSVLQSVYSAMMNADGTAANIASLVFEANIDSFGIPNMMEQMETAEYRDQLLERLTLAAAGKSITKTLVHDAEEIYARHSVSFASLPDTMQIFLLMASAGADIPLTRFLGQAPSGLSSTGEGDMKNYYDRITSAQELELTPAMWRLDEAIIRSALGDRPDEIFYNWTPLEQVNEVQRSEIGLRNAQTIEIIGRANLFEPEEMRKAFSNQLIESGMYPGLAEIMKEADAANEFDLGGEVTENGAPVIEGGSEEIQKLALNGAQIQSLQKLVAAVAEGTMPKATAIAVIAAAFPAMTAKEIEAIMGPLNGFKAPIIEKPKSKLTGDAKPATLYVRRNVLNAAEIIKWAKKNGFGKTLKPEDLHVTIAFSEKALDWMTAGSAWDDELKVTAGGPRMIERFDGGAVVLLFSNHLLEWRHTKIIEAGATWKWSEYQPHITFTYDDPDVDVENMEAFQGEIILGPEIFQKLDEKWKENITLDKEFI